MTPLSYIQENHYWAACNASQDLHKERVACRYYQAGNCRRGSNCPFAHVSIAAQIESPTIPHPMYSSENMCTYYPLVQNPVYLSSPARPVFLWQPYPPLSPSHDPRYGLVCQTDNLPDYPDDESDPSSAESSCTATSMDRRHRTALDTAWSEPLEYLGTVRSVAGPPGDVAGTNLSSPRYPAYNYPVFPGAQTEGVVSGADRATSGPCLDRGSMVALTSPLLPTCQEDSKKRVFAYKTKPCKFYAVNGQCTSGEKCTFIHDPESQGKSCSKLALQTEAELPPKPIDKYDESRARDFYPITWRVIGGGVMMGGKRRVCPAFAAGQCKLGDDCPLAHETELETDDVGYIEPKSEPARGNRRTATPTSSPPQGAKGTTPKRGRTGASRGRSKVTSAETPRPVVLPLATPRPQRPPLPATEGTAAARKKGEQVIASAPASPVHRRTQSMTMVVSPPPVNTHTSYAAEL